MHKFVALIAGSTGAVGTALARELASNDEWKVYGIARRAPASPLERVSYSQLDLNGRKDCVDVLSSLGDVTHVFYCGRATHAEQVIESTSDNLRLLDNLVWGYPFNRSYHMFSAWRILALASTTRARLASFKPGFEPMRTAWTTSNGCGGPTASSVRVAATKAVGAWAMAASCVRRVRHAVR